MFYVGAKIGFSPWRRTHIFTAFENKELRRIF
jgi:hypothetical protein